MLNRKNLFESKLASGISSTAETFSVTTGEGQYAPASNFVLGIYHADYASPAAAMKAGKHEWVIVGSRTADACSSVTRGAFGSTALNHNETGYEYVVYNPVTAQELIGMNTLYKDTGGDDAYVITTGHSITDTILPFLDGVILPLRVDTVNTGACALTLDSATSKAIKVVDANGVRDPLTGEIPADGIAVLQWSEDDDYFVLLNPVAAASNSDLSHLPFAYASGLGANVTRYIVPAMYNVEADDGDMRYYMSGSGSIKSFTFTGRSGTSPAQDYTDTYTLRKNGVDTAMTLSIVKNSGSIAQKTGTSTGDPVSFVDGDWIDIKVVCNGTTFINLVGHIKVNFTS